MSEPYKLSAEEMRLRNTGEALAFDVKAAVKAAHTYLPHTLGQLIADELGFQLQHVGWIGEQKLRQIIADTHLLAAQLAATERKTA